MFLPRTLCSTWKPALIRFLCAASGFWLPFGALRADYALRAIQAPAKDRRHARQVVRGKGEDRLRLYLGQSNKAGLAKTAHRLRPAEDLFHQLALLQALRVGRVPARTPINGTARLRSRTGSWCRTGSTSVRCSRQQALPAVLEEVLKGGLLGQALHGLRTAAGGSPPCPDFPPSDLIASIEAASGNAQAVEISKHKVELEQTIADWAAKKTALAARQPAWRRKLPL